MGKKQSVVLLRELPLLPVEEEGRLCDPRLRESFVERIFAYRRLRALFQCRWTVGNLVRFHAGEKLLLLAHDPSSYGALGRLVARAKRLPRAQVEKSYGETFMHALRVAATRGRNANALAHMAGYLKEELSRRARRRSSASRSPTTSGASCPSSSR